MNRINIILILIILLIALTDLSAQKTNLGFDTGYGTFEMTQIKHILESSLSTNILQPHCVSNFPGYLFFRPYFELDYQYFNVGVAYTLMSTGSRYSIHDYSGEYKLDAQIVGKSAGVFIEIPIYSYKRFKFLISGESGIIFNKMKIDETLQLTDIYKQNEESKFVSNNIYIKPYLKAQYDICRNFSANLLIGYHKDLTQNKMYFDDNNSKESVFIANWNGIRTSIGLSYGF